MRKSVTDTRVWTDPEKIRRLQKELAKYLIINWEWTGQRRNGLECGSCHAQSDSPLTNVVHENHCLLAGFTP